MAKDIPLRKTNTGQQALSYVGQKIWTKISHSTKNTKAMVYFTHTLLQRKILSKQYR